MPNIHGVVTFYGTGDVLVRRGILDLPPEEAMAILRLAFDHLRDKDLLEADCGGRGPLVDHHHWDMPRYLVELEKAECARSAKEAKKTATRERRTRFNCARNVLILKMIEAGFVYKCSEQGCAVHEGLTVDHIVPLSRGGTDDLDNLQFMCRSHNSSKGDR